ncbi:alpha/beta hydrolase [Natrialba sp. PRR66]|uniref:alpha/beta fold hydrolase n=1 Tax=Natrialba sp. PRR66 TaxID=3098146 RepID=UPI002B1CFB1B|nr:alpha/beta hydrolase [Natrialba sp. PRR66]
MKKESPTVARYRERASTVITDAGDGPPIVFAHGMLMDRTLFNHQLAALSNNYRTISYDLRARTDRYNESYDLEDLAADLDALLDALQIESVVLAGISMGGFMALRFVEHYPQRVNGLVLINSMAEPHTEAEREEYSALAKRVLDEGVRSERVRHIARTKMFGESTLEDNPTIVDHWEKRWATYPPESVYHAMHSWIDRSDYTHKLPNIEIPVLSIHGKENTVLAPKRTESMLNTLPDARQTVVSAAGHSAPVEQPDEVTDAIREFLSEVVL